MHTFASIYAAAKADIENKAVIAAVNRCATQNQGQNRVLPQPVKPRPFKGVPEET
jgi:hypothetical protein